MSINTLTDTSQYHVEVSHLKDQSQSCVLWLLHVRNLAGSCWF